MAGGRVLLIEDDEWSAAVLKRSLEEASYEVEIATEARAGLERARQDVPDCVICDVVLPDIDGFWVARRLRTDPGPVRKIPFVFLTGVDDVQSRLQGLEMGADVYITKPFRHEEVVAQVGALIGMAERFRLRDSMVDLEASAHGIAAFRGDLAQMSLSTLLSMLEMERRTGSLKLKGKLGTAEVHLVEGALVRLLINGKTLQPVQGMRELLHWDQGRFSFQAAVPPGPRVGRHSVAALLLEALRLEDEARRGSQ